MEAAGARLADIRAGKPLMDLSRIRGYLELHIEQGPVLTDEGLPVGIVTEIRGNRRWPGARCTGAYSHSGTTPRHLRADAVAATGELIAAMNRFWREMDAQGEDLVLTFGRLATDPDAASTTTVAGEVRFSLDIRSLSQQALERAEAELARCIERIEADHRVAFDMGHSSADSPAAMAPTLCQALAVAADRHGVPVRRMPSGAGHDAGDFAQAGIPSAMVFVRNENGSHNPEEWMSFEDFAMATRLMASVLEREADGGRLS